MPFPLSTALVDLTVLDHTGSTNDEVRARASGGADLLTVATLDQRSGRGRSSRSWVTPRGRGLAVSTLLRMDARAAISADTWGWVPLIAGAAMSRALEAVLPEREARLKWPNDVLIAERKVCGILTEVVDGGTAIVIGAGVNLDLDEEELPVPQATSLAREGALLRGEELADEVVSRWLAGVAGAMDALAEHSGDVGASGIRAQVIAACTTIGRPVEVLLPGGGGFTGIAVGIDVDGRLLVDRGSDQELTAVAAGDVRHLRHA